MEENNLIDNPALYGSGCVLSAQGIGFDPKAFSSQTTFDSRVILAIGKLGLPKLLKKKIAELEGLESSSFLEATFLIIRISDSGINAIQHKEAIEFLRQNREEVLRLSKFPNVEQVNLQFRLDEGNSFEDHSEELLDLGSECGLSIIM